MVALGIRRVAAYAIDWLVIMVYGVAMFGVMFAIHGWDGLAELAEDHNPFRAQAISFFSITLPFVLYFAILESRSRAATVGKRIVGLRVLAVDGGKATFGRTLVRAAVKFVPWEIGHLYANNFFAHNQQTPDAPLPMWLWVAFALSMGGALIYAASLFVGAGATPYDRVSKTRVVVDRGSSD